MWDVKQGVIGHLFSAFLKKLYIVAFVKEIFPYTQTTEKTQETCSLSNARMFEILTWIRSFFIEIVKEKSQYFFFVILSGVAEKEFGSQMPCDWTKIFLCTFEAYFLTKVHEN